MAEAWHGLQLIQENQNGLQELQHTGRTSRGVVGLAPAMSEPHSYGTLSSAVPKQTLEAQTGSQCNPCWEILSFVPQEGFTVQDCAFQSAANNRLNWVRPPQARLNNK